MSATECVHWPFGCDVALAFTQAAGVHHVDAARLQRYRTALLQSFGRSDSLM